jgi:hypothetical protein
MTATVLAESAVEFFKTHKLERRDPRVRRSSVPRCSLDTQSRDTKLPAIGDGPNWIRRLIGYDVERRGRGESQTRFSPDGVSCYTAPNESYAQNQCVEAAIVARNRSGECLDWNCEQKN